MQYCPIDFLSTEKKVIIENFDSGSDNCMASLVPLDNQDSNDSNNYLGKRNSNIKTLENQYNNELSKYLNAYNTYLLNRSMLKNSPPGSATQSQLATATDKAKKEVLDSRRVLKQMQKDLEINNKKTNDVISFQSKNISEKANKIKEKDQHILEQSRIIDEKTKLLNSRTRQIELGITKNKYKRNVMWMLVATNIIFIIAISSFFIFTNKN